MSESTTTVPRQETEQQQEQEGNRLFPVFLKLEEFRVLIVGGGNVALEKTLAVLNNSPGTVIRLVAKSVLPEIRALKENYPNLLISQRGFEESDLDEKDLVIVAVNNKTLAREIRDLAASRKIFTNVADTPELCDFYLGSVVSKGDLKVAISTNGKSPTLAKRLREAFEEHLPADLQEAMENLNRFRTYLRGSFTTKVRKMNEATIALIEKEKRRKPRYRNTRIVLVYILSALALMIGGHLLFSFLPLAKIGAAFGSLAASVDATILWFMLGGFLAQMVDGALGMAYGVSATTFLLSCGIPPAAASASVHASEIFTTGASGLMHLRFGNVNKKLFRNLLIPGVIGAILGAYVLSSLQEYGAYLKPITACYTLFLGVVILLKALKKDKVRKRIKRIVPLAALGGFLDSIGGGGWGPIVSSTLIAGGRTPRYTIGSVNLAEFFITLASSLTFASLIGISHWQIIAGLVIGGCIAAPIAAYFSSRLPTKAIMLMVAVVVIVVSLRIMYISFF